MGCISVSMKFSRNLGFKIPAIAPLNLTFYLLKNVNLRCHSRKNRHF
ncbi:hypothetical protein CKA32_004741 [Geitlerinema sp. FC II]|nr:hypothetical protein CKA32_004741 [Geitlerinema sp. FC II]